MKIKFAIYRYRWGRLLLAVFCLLPVPYAAARDVSIPVQIDYQYLQQALIKQIYTGPELSREVWNDATGCGSIVLSDPRIDSQNGLLRITNTTLINISLPMGTGCVPVFRQTGIVETYHQPQIEKNRAVLRFDVVDMKVYNQDKTPLVQGRALELLKQFAGPQLAAMRIDLEPALAEIKQFLPEVMPEENAESLRKVLDSLAFQSIAAEQATLDVMLGLTVDDKPRIEHPEPPLTPAELDRWEQHWQQWDAFITYTIKQLSAHSKSDEVRETLLELLIETRYDILTLLSGPVDQASDPVRDMFVNVWSRLAPVLREVSHELKGDLFLHYTTFIVAGDILQVLDHLGPGVGLEISVDGMRRMARMLAPDDSRDPLEYNLDIDPLLRKLFDTSLSPPVDDPLPPDKLSWLVKSAYASTGNASLRRKLSNWVPAREEIGEYLPLVHQLLTQTAAETQKSKKLDSSYKKLFHDMLLATAWQESCWRQFIKSGGDIKPIMSVSGSVGIMQVNRKVWRGFYDVKQLEKDIAYNATAGSEILLHYFRDYALKKEAGKKGGVDNLARATYGAYNGGPRHLTRYRESGTRADLRKIDESFWSKYQKIKSGDIQAVAGCYGETRGAARPNNRPAEKKQAAGTPAPPSRPSGKSARLLQSNPQHFTIQLMSSRNETQLVKFMQENKLEGKAEYYIYRHNNETWYGLIYGSYITRKAAEDEARSLQKRLKLPSLWVRQIADIKKLVK